MNDKKLIAEALLEIAKKSTTEFIEDSKIDKELIEAAKKIGISIPSPDLCLFKTVYCEISKKNLNGVILPRKAVEEGLHTLVGKNCNWEHNGSGFICGYTIKAEINEDKVETINVLFKSLFPDQIEELKEKIKTKEAAVSFEIWNISPLSKKSVVKELKDGTKEISPIIFHGTGVLLSNPPACPKAKIFCLVSNKTIQEAEKIVDRIFSEDLIYASLVITDPKCTNCGKCNCAREVKIITKQIDSKQWICPHCEKEIGEKELFYDEKNQKWYHRPCQEKGEIILPKENTEKKEERKVDLKELYVNIAKEEDITFDLAMAFYYASDEEQKTLTEDAAKWTRKFINNLPDSAFAEIEPAYPEKVQDKNCRHLPHHNGEGDLGKDKSNAKLDLPHYKNALARVNQIKPISDSISSEDLQKKASAHLERHKDALEKSEIQLPTETKTEEKATETQVAPATTETKVEEPKVEETKEVKPEEKAQELQVVEPKIISKVTTEWREVRISTYVEGTPSGTDDVKGYFKKTTEYTDGTKDEVEEERSVETKYTFSQLEEAINKAKEELTNLHKAELEAKTNEIKADLEKKITEKETEIANLKKENEKQLGEKDTEIKNLKTELGNKTQEIAKIENEDKDKTNLSVGTVIKNSDGYEKIRDEVNEKAFGKKK